MTAEISPSVESSSTLQTESDAAAASADNVTLVDPLTDSNIGYNSGIKARFQKVRTTSILLLRTVNSGTKAYMYLRSFAQTENLNFIF